MRIVITLGGMNLRWGGIRVYTEEVVRHMLAFDRANEYVLLYPRFGLADRNMGAYSRKYSNVTEKAIGPAWLRSELYWDQVVVPRHAAQLKPDVLFNPFLSVPILGRFKKVMVMHAVEYHTVPKVYDWKMYLRWWFLENAIMPAADRVISISNLMQRDMQRLVRYPLANVRTVYHGVHEKFRVIDDSAALQAMKAKYSLPDRFMLFVGHIYPQKNFDNLVRALHLIGDRVPHRLVVIGRPRWQYKEILQVVTDLGLQERIMFLNEVINDDLPAIYNLADCMVYPSLYEAFGLVQLEAMACGCPVVAANTGAIPEISGGAALLFDPLSAPEMAEKIVAILTESGLRQTYVERGLSRARDFTWERCARETLKVLQDAASN